MRNRFGVAGVIIATVVTGMLSFGSYNLLFRPPPDARAIRILLEGEPFIGVINGQTGESVLPPSSSELRVIGIYPYPWGVVTSYYNAAGQGVGTLERGLFGWGFSSYGWGPRSAMEAGTTLVYDHAQEYVGFRRPDVEVVYGIRIDERATAVRVLFDDGDVLEQDLDAGHFSIASDRNGGACTIQVVDASGAILESIDLEPRTPYNVNPARYDCTP
jgi:hypothetical protein